MRRKASNELANALHRTVSCPLLELRSKTYLREAHLNNLSRRTPRKRGEVDPHLAIARAKIEDAETFEEAAEFLDHARNFLNSRIVPGELLALPPS